MCGRTGPLAVEAVRPERSFNVNSAGKRELSPPFLASPLTINTPPLHYMYTKRALSYLGVPALQRDLLLITKPPL